MDKFHNELEAISNDLLLLVEKKLYLKNEVTNPNLNWQERMDFYSKIRLINEYIENYSYRKNF